MARKKTILKKDILSAADELVREEGFKGITARNIAKRMDCSTQPIYLEFKNMNELKEELFQNAQGFLDETVFSKERTGKPLLDTCLNYIEFAEEEKTFFTALYLEGEIPPKEIHEVSYEHFKKAFEKDYFISQMAEPGKVELFETLWPYVHGTASLVAQDCLVYDEQTMTGKVKTVIKALFSPEIIPTK